jgi:hypothetical protein
MAKIELNVADSAKSPLGKDVSIEIDWTKLAAHSAVCEYILRHGLKQMLGDAYHTTKGSDEVKFAASQKKLDSLYAGNAVQERVGGGDPVAREMREMAETDVRAKVKAAGKKWAEVSKETKIKVIAAQLAKNEEAYRKAAIAKLAIKPKAVDTDDIMDLFD